jgi:hypothetical protein
MAEYVPKLLRDEEVVGSNPATPDAGQWPIRIIANGPLMCCTAAEHSNLYGSCVLARPLLLLARALLLAVLLLAPAQSLAELPQRSPTAGAWRARVVWVSIPSTIAPGRAEQTWMS